MALLLHNTECKHGTDLARNNYADYNGHGQTAVADAPVPMLGTITTSEILCQVKTETAAIKHHVHDVVTPSLLLAALKRLHHLNTLKT